MLLFLILANQIKQHAGVLNLGQTADCPGQIIGGTSAKYRLAQSMELGPNHIIIELIFRIAFCFCWLLTHHNTVL